MAYAVLGGWILPVTVYLLSFLVNTLDVDCNWNNSLPHHLKIIYFCDSTGWMYSQKHSSAFSSEWLDAFDAYLCKTVTKS